jgi:hypothetical protein
MAEEKARKKLVEKLQTVYAMGRGDGLAKKRVMRKRAVGRGVVERSKNNNMGRGVAGGAKKRVTKRKVTRKGGELIDVMGGARKKRVSKRKSMKKSGGYGYCPYDNAGPMRMRLRGTGKSGGVLVDSDFGNEYMGSGSAGGSVRGGARKKKAKTAKKKVPRSVSPWVQRLREYSAQNGVSYKQAMQDLAGTS